MALSTEDLIAKEAKYHKSCYRDITKIIYESRNKEPDECKSTELTVMDNAFREVKNYSLNTQENPTFIEHIVLTSILEKELLNYKVDKDSIMHAKINLKRRIERDMQGIRLSIMVQRKCRCILIRYS